MEASCPVCGITFLQRTKRHIFDKRKCFKTEYYKKIRDEQSFNRFPSFVCPECSRLTNLDFNPKKNGEEWEKFYCPYCEYKNNFKS